MISLTWKRIFKFGNWNTEIENFWLRSQKLESRNFNRGIGGGKLECDESMNEKCVVFSAGRRRKPFVCETEREAKRAALLLLQAYVELLRAVLGPEAALAVRHRLLGGQHQVRTGEGG